MLFAILVTTVGIALSAFFSGSETGFYRVTRVRLATDAKSGNLVPRALHWLVSHSSLVVATVLIGNNLANYLVSLGLILISQRLFTDSIRLEALLPVLLTPVLFVYGELLPKYFFYQVPYQLLRRSAPFMLFCTVLFAPISIFVIIMEYAWRHLVGGIPSQAASTLERQELQRVLVEGQEAGVVLPIQREIAQNLFSYGVRPIRQFATPLRAVPTVPQGATAKEISDAADRSGQTIVGVAGKENNHLIGCYLASDTLLQTETPVLSPVCTALATDSNIQVLSRLQDFQSPLAQVVDTSNRVLGVVSRERLSALLLS